MNELMSMVLVAILFAVLLIAAFLAGFSFGDKVAGKKNQAEPVYSKRAEKFQDSSGAYSYKAAMLNQSIEDD